MRLDYFFFSPKLISVRKFNNFSEIFLFNHVIFSFIRVEVKILFKKIEFNFTFDQ